MADGAGNRVEEIFLEVIKLPLPERPSFIDRECGGDAALRSDVLTLVAAHEAAGQFMANPTGDPTAAMPRSGEAPVVEGTRIGHYHIRRVIVMGGMGIVYEAVQEHPHRTVLKGGFIDGPGIVRSIRRDRGDGSVDLL